MAWSSRSGQKDGMGSCCCTQRHQFAPQVLLGPRHTRFSRPAPEAKVRAEALGASFTDSVSKEDPISSWSVWIARKAAELAVRTVSGTEWRGLAGFG